MVRVALVEDSRSKAAMVETILSNAARLEHTITVGSIEAGEEFNDDTADIILVDRVLPDGDGMRLADSLSRRLKSARVYLYSSTNPPPLLPPTVGYLRDADIRHWPAVLEPMREYPGVLVRHPRKAKRDQTA